MPLAEFNAALREQFLMLLRDEEAALAALPKLALAALEDRARALEAIRRIAAGPGRAGRGGSCGRPA